MDPHDTCEEDWVVHFENKIQHLANIEKEAFLKIEQSQKLQKEMKKKLNQNYF